MGVRFVIGNSTILTPVGPADSARFMNAGICAATAALYLASASFHRSIGRSSIADAAIVATRARVASTSPLPSGCTRFDIKTTKVSDVGSIQIIGPVKPVCPNDPKRKKLAAIRRERGVHIPPQPPRHPSSETTYGCVIFAHSEPRERGPGIPALPCSLAPVQSARSIASAHSGQIVAVEKSPCMPSYTAHSECSGIMYLNPQISSP
jgi:hypothetical protein